MDRDKARKQALRLAVSGTYGATPVPEVLERADAYERWLTREDPPKAKTGTSLTFSTLDETHEWVNPPAITPSPDEAKGMPLWRKLVSEGRVSGRSYRYFVRKSVEDVYRVRCGAGLDAPSEYYRRAFGNPGWTLPSTWSQHRTFEGLYTSEDTYEVGL